MYELLTYITIYSTTMPRSTVLEHERAFREATHTGTCRSVGSVTGSGGYGSMAGVCAGGTLLASSVNFADCGAGFVVPGVELVGCRSVRVAGEAKDPG